jgi:hypothetical protein
MLIVTVRALLDLEAGKEAFVRLLKEEGVLENVAYGFSCFLLTRKHMGEFCASLYLLPIEHITSRHLKQLRRKSLK